MTSAWDTAGRRWGRLREGSGESARPRRLSGEEAVASGPNRREQANLRVVQLRDERIIEERMMEAHQPQKVGWNLLGLKVDADGVFAFLIFLPLLFIAKLGPMGAAAVAALLPAYVFVRRERLMQVLMPRAFLFLPPALALFSVIWSQAPSETF
jgi:exopolysaccharide production protein ExoQ